MGISISLLVSRAVPQDRWEAVYNEALSLARNLELACIEKKEIMGQSVYCLAPVEETVENGKTCWYVCSDLNTRQSAEWYSTPKSLSDSPCEDNFDIIIHRALDRDIISDEKNLECPRHLWGDKTQGHFYHIGMLAIGCLIQDRLGDKAYVYGDINAGQCRRAVELANKYLGKAIQVPCQADLNRWIERVKALPLPEENRVRIFFDMFIGAKKEELGDAARSNFSSDAIMEYWKRSFSWYDMNVVGFGSILKKYLSMGFGIADLCDIVSFTSSKGEDQRARFIKHIMDAKMHWKEKDCSDWMEQDPDDPALYGIEALFIRAFSFGVRNKKVDRFIPLEEIRAILRDKIPGFDVDAAIDDYIENESSMEDASVDVNRMINQSKDTLDQKVKSYDISIVEYLRDYKAGNTVTPDVKELVKGIMEFWQKKIIDNDEYKKIMDMTRDERLNWLAYQSRRFPNMTENEWTRIMEWVDGGNTDRYCGLFCIKLNSREISEVVRALAINDDLYEYGRGLMET